MLEFLNAGATQIRAARGAIIEASAAAEAFDIAPVLARYQAAEKIDADNTRRLWRELVRFLMLVACFPDRRYGMHGPADELWHHFVLHTELYQRFCELHAGRFLHHHPDSVSKGAAWRSRYLQFLVDYRRAYGETPPDDIWPLPHLRWIDLPASAARLRQRHVKAVEDIEMGRRYPPRRERPGGGGGCATGGDFGGGDSGGGDGGSGDGGGCGGGCSG